MGDSRIFLVEDDGDLRDSYLVALKAYGHLSAFGNAKEFLARLVKHPDEMPDLVITDLSMPHMTGVQMVAEARAAGAQFTAILLSGQVNKESAVEALNAGFSMILEKPVASRQLREAVRHFVLLKDAEKARREILGTVEKMLELQAAFREICINELGLREATLSDTIIDPNGSEATLSLAEELDAIKLKLDSLRTRELNSLKEIETARAKIKAA